MTKAQEDALKWLRERNGTGVWEKPARLRMTRHLYDIGTIPGVEPIDRPPVRLVHRLGWLTLAAGFVAGVLVGVWL